MDARQPLPTNAPDIEPVPPIRLGNETASTAPAQRQPVEFSDDTIKALANLGNALRKAERELWARGYCIRDGKVVKH